MRRCSSEETVTYPKCFVLSTSGCHLVTKVPCKTGAVRLGRMGWRSVWEASSPNPPHPPAPLPNFIPLRVCGSAMLFLKVTLSGLKTNAKLMLSLGYCLFRPVQFLKPHLNLALGKGTLVRQTKLSGGISGWTLSPGSSACGRSPAV